MCDGNGECFRLEQRVKVLEAVCALAVETLTTVDDWQGHASTRQAAVDALFRLSRALQRAGFPSRVTDDLRWRGSIIRALEQAGVGLDEDGVAVRVRMKRDQPWQHASGPVISPDRLWSIVWQHGSAEDVEDMKERRGQA